MQNPMTWMIRSKKYFAVATVVAAALVALTSFQSHRSGKSPFPAGKTVRVTTSVPASRKAVRIPMLSQATTNGPKSWLALINQVDAETGPMQSEYRADTLQAVVSRIAVGDLPVVWDQVRDLVSRHPSPGARELQMRLFQRWSECDLYDAAKSLIKFPLEERAEAYERLAGVWANRDLLEATQWARLIPENENRDRALGVIANIMSQSNPESALSIAAAMSPTELRDQVILQATSTWAASEPSAAFDSATQIENETLQSRAIASIATVLADHDPQGAARLLTSSVKPSATRESAMLEVLRRWNEQDSKEMADWLRRSPEVAFTLADDMAAIRLGLSRRDELARLARQHPEPTSN